MLIWGILLFSMCRPLMSDSVVSKSSVSRKKIQSKRRRKEKRQAGVVEENVHHARAYHQLLAPGPLGLP